jgi:hypothetical protein
MAPESLATPQLSKPSWLTPFLYLQNRVGPTSARRCVFNLAKRFGP